MKIISKVPLLSALLLAFAIIASCGGNPDGGGLSGNKASGEIENGSIYARHFTIEESDSSIKSLIIKNTWSGKLKDEKYLLVPRDCTKLLSENIYTIPYPVKNVVCMSSSHVAYMAALGQARTIKGISGTRFIYNKEVRQLIKNGIIEDVGGENLPNYELIMSMKPDVVIAYGISGADNSYIEKLQKLGVKTLTIGDYLENSPLGKLEYMKLFGALCGKSAMADSLFSHKVEEYLKIKEKIFEAVKGSSRTKVMLNAPYKGIWYIPGGDNYTSQLIKDAGGIILGSVENSSQSTQSGFEQAYAYALQADVWLHPNTMKSIDDIISENNLFKNIPALKNGRVYNNTLRNTPEGGSDFWETGVIEPHIILHDLALILHPELFEGESGFEYYTKLE